MGLLFHGAAEAVPAAGFCGGLADAALSFAAAFGSALETAAVAGVGASPGGGAGVVEADAESPPQSGGSDEASTSELGAVAASVLGCLRSLSIISVFHVISSSVR